MERWFLKRRQSKILDIAYRQMTVALDTVNDLEKAIKGAYAKNTKISEKAIERLFGIEEEVDVLRRAVFEELTRGNLTHIQREDIMHLVKRLDMMADHVKDSARNVKVLLYSEIPEEIWEAFCDMAAGLSKTAAVLRDSLKNLGDDPSKARAISEKVEDEENKVDQKFLEIKSLLLKHGETISPAVLILLKDLLDSMEEATDSCADTGDYIRILTVSFK